MRGRSSLEIGWRTFNEPGQPLSCQVLWGRVRVSECQEERGLRAVELERAGSQLPPGN